jgi:hypothetical protein
LVLGRRDFVGNGFLLLLLLLVELLFAVLFVLFFELSAASASKLASGLIDAAACVAMATVPEASG